MMNTVVKTRSISLLQLLELIYKYINFHRLHTNIESLQKPSKRTIIIEKGRKERVFIILSDIYINILKNIVVRKNIEIW